MSPKAKKQTGGKRRSKSWHLPAWTGYLLFIAGMGIFLFLVIQYDFTQDDAYITFRYAANFVDGHGLVYNAGERVEGYTNFLWTILMILGRLIGVDLVLFSKIAGALFGLATIAMTFALARELFADISPPQPDILAGLCALVMGSVYSFAYWAVAGLETAAFGFMIVAALYAYIRRSYLSIPAAVMATLLRPEGGLVFAFIVLYEIISRRSFTRFAAMMIALYLLYLMPYAVFKLTYYGSLLPNPFYAKTTFTMEQLRNGLDYTGQFFWHYLAAGALFVPAVFVAFKAQRKHRLIMIFILIYTLYIIFIGGDVLKVHRFFVPLFPLYVIAAIYGLYLLFRQKTALFVVSVIALMAWQMIVPRGHVATFHRREVGLSVKMTVMMDNLRASDTRNFSLAASTIGLVGYKLLGHTIIDMLGLTDSTIARHPEPPIEGLETTWRETHYNSRYLLSRQPDYILFSTGSKPSAPAERALFLYSAFLDNYRTIAFFYGTLMHPAYKRYFPIEGEITRDVGVDFVQYLNQGMNLLRSSREGNLRALAMFDSALACGPRRPYPYVYYYKSEALLDMDDIPSAYKCLLQGAQFDTLVYELYKDLYQYEFRTGNLAAAQEYRARVAYMVPWYIPRLDSLVRGLKPRGGSGQRP